MFTNQGWMHRFVLLLLLNTSPQLKKKKILSMKRNSDFEEVKANTLSSGPPMG